MDRVLAAFEVDPVEFFVVVALFSADPRAVQLDSLPSEARCEILDLHPRLAHLVAQGIVSCGPERRWRPASEFQLTDLGRDMAAYVIYRVIGSLKQTRR